MLALKFKSVKPKNKQLKTRTEVVRLWAQLSHLTRQPAYDLPTVDRKIVPGNESCVAGGKEGKQCCNLFWAAYALQWHLIREYIQPFALV